MSTNRYSIEHAPVDLSQYHCVALKLCEFCGIPHITEAPEALIPGDLLPLQRAVGRRTPIVCNSCRRSRKYNLSFIREEAEEMLRIVAEIRREREVRASFEDDVHRFRKPVELMHQSHHTQVQ